MRKEKRYIGYWNYNNDSTTIAGNLIVGKDITLELVEFNDQACYTYTKIDSLRGVALDDNNDTFFFVLYNLEFLCSHISNMGVQSYVFSVSYLVFSNNQSFHSRNDNIINVSEISISSPYLNAWCCSRLNIHDYESSEEEVNYHYEQPSSFLLSELVDRKVTVYISRSTMLIPNKCFYNTLEPFINITFHKEVELNDSFSFVKKIENLLSLFMNTPFVNESIQFNLGRIRCTCIQNLKTKHYNFHQIPDDDARFTSIIQDIMGNDIINRWIVLYNEEFFALSLYFNTIYNEELSHELQIICYASVLEELTRRYFSQEELPHTRKNNILLHIIDILRNDQHLKEANDLKTMYIDKRDYFENRLLNLLLKFQDIWKMIEIDEFAKRTAITRNFLVHRKIPDSQKQYLFAPYEYHKVACMLRFIIAGTLLKELGSFSEDDINRILCFIHVYRQKNEDYTWLKPEVY